MTNGKLLYSPTKQEDPIDRFNRMLGNRTGRPISHQVPVYSSPNPHARTLAVSRGDYGVPRSVVRNYRSMASPAGGSSAASSPSTQVSGLQGVYNQLLTDFSQSQQEQLAINNAQEEAQRQEDSDRPFWEDAWNTLTGNAMSSPGTGFAGSIIGRGLNLISRPAWAEFEGLRSAVAGHDPTGATFSPQDVFNFARAAPSGLTGETQTGFGQVYEAAKNTPVSGIALRNFEAAHPNWEQALAIGVGAIGEIGLDPLNVAIPALPRVIGRGSHAGRVATESLLRETVAENARRLAEDIVNNPALMDSTAYYTANPDLLVERLIQSADDAFTRAAVNVHEGGNPALRLMNNRTWPTHVANAAVSDARRVFTEELVNITDDLWDLGSKGNFPESFVDHFRQTNDDFSEFWDELTKRLDGRGEIPPNASTQDVLDAVERGATSQDEINKIRDVVANKYDAELDPIFQRHLADTRNPTYRTVGIKIAGRQIPFRTVGRAFEWAGTKLDNVFPNLQNLANENIFGKAFPGIFSLKTGRARALGFAGYNEFKDKLQEFARGFSRDESHQIMDALEKGVRIGDPRKDRAIDFIRDHLQRIFGEEQYLAARNPNDVFRANYNPVFLRGGSSKAREAFRAGRAKAYREFGNPGKWTIEEAARMGLRPERNAFENLLFRYAESRRALTQAIFRDDLVGNYASHAIGVTEKGARERGLHLIPTNRLSQSYREMVKVHGGAFYMPNEIWGIADKFEQMSRWTSAEWGVLGRSFAKVISKLKIAMTLPYVGFHMRNLIGDVFMGLLDGVNPNDYAVMASKWAASKAGRSAMVTIIPGVLEMSFDDIVKLYKQNADAGFFHMETGTYASMTAGQIPKRMGRHLMNTAIDISDTREVMGRITHFYAAYKQEAEALWGRGIRDLNEIERRAADAALWRTNAYKYDYSALLPWEQKIKTAAFPFYTYARKAIPTLLENMYVNPRYFAALNRFMTYNDGSAADGFNAMNIPQWIQDIGFAVGDGEEPWMVTADALPMGALGLLGSSSAGDLAGNVLDYLNPIAKAPIELWSHKNIHTGAPENEGLLDYIIKNTPLVHDVADLVTGGMPSGTEMLSNRLVGLGLPVRRLSTRQQQQQQQANRDRLIDNPIRKFNYSQDAYSVSVTDDMKYHVTNKITGELIGIFNTPQAAIQFAMSQPGASYQQPYVSPYHQPTWADVQTMMGR